MRLNERLRASIEAISFQDGGFFRELTEAFEEVFKVVESGKRDAQSINKAIKDCKFEVVVKKHTNITLKPVIHNEQVLDAYVYPPRIDVNNPLVYDWWKPYLNNKDGLDVIRKAKSPLTFTIDSGKARVSGYLADIKLSTGIYTGLFTDKVIRAEHVAAIMLHEIGHIFTYFEVLGQQFRTNAIMDGVQKAFFGTQDHKERKVVLDEYSKVTGQKLIDSDKLVTINDKEKLTTILLTTQYLEVRNISGSYAYDIRASEQLADDFVSRQGGGRALAIAMDRIHTFYGSSEKRAKALHWTLEIIHTVGLLATFSIPPLGVLFTMAAILGSDPDNKIYDDPKERIGNMRRQAIEGLKQARNSEEKQRFLDDIKEITHIESTYNEGNKPLFEYLWRWMSPKRSNSWNQLLFQKGLEELASNKIYVSAARISEVSSKV